MNENDLLEHLCKELDYVSGDLIEVENTPSLSSSEQWLDKGGWLSLANKVGDKVSGAQIEKIFFVDNNPVILFGRCADESVDVNLFFQRAWCMARPSLLFLALPGELRVYSLNVQLERDKQGWKLPKELHLVNKIRDISEQLNTYHRENIESGLFFQDHRFNQVEGRADRQFIEDLKYVRFELMRAGLRDEKASSDQQPKKKLKYAHSLIGRSIFIRYMEDRGILTPDYFGKVAQLKEEWKDIIAIPLNGPDIDPAMQNVLFMRVLQDKSFTYALFRQLAIDFNGDMFPKDAMEEEYVQQNHLNILLRFLRGDILPQCKIFFSAYKFDIIPTELISNIYEEFYHQQEGEDDKGTHYTPSSLVEFVLRQVLTQDLLEKKPRILDPACGSGIFLVESFRRIVRFNIVKNHGDSLTHQQLRSIIKDQLLGIEINGEAIGVAAFSLYLAFLNYQEPPDILTQIKQGYQLPNLTVKDGQETNYQFYNILMPSDAFNTFESKVICENFNSQVANIVVGNPPWGTASKKALTWCSRRNLPVGRKEFSQAFIWRTLDLLKPEGVAGLLVTTGIFFKQQDWSKKFRENILESTEINQVINFAHVRDVFFNSAMAPFAFIEFRKAKPKPSHLVHYWVAKKTASVNGQQAVILSYNDLRSVYQTELKKNDLLWKLYFWGSHRDRSLIEMLSYEKTLGELVLERGWPYDCGFKPKYKNSKSYPAAWLKNYTNLNTRKIKRYGAIDKGAYKNVGDEIYRFGKEELYRDWRIIVKHGISQNQYDNRANGIIVARLDQEPYCFQHSIYGIGLKNATECERKVLLGILWSSIPRYFFFHTSANWGMWHDKIHMEELLRLPVRITGNKLLLERISSIVDDLRSWNPIQRNLSNLNGLSDEEISLRIHELEYNLDEAIFELYELSDFDRDLIRDTCNIGLEFFYRHITSDAIKPVVRKLNKNFGFLNEIPISSINSSYIEGYLEAFLQIWNQELYPDGEFSWQILNSAPDSTMVAVIFATQEKNRLTAIPIEEGGWKDVLKDLSNNLLIPYNSNRIFIDGIVRVVTDSEIIIIKRNERRFWTRSSAREDAEVTLLQAIEMQEYAKEG